MQSEESRVAEARWGWGLLQYYHGIRTQRHSSPVIITRCMSEIQRILTPIFILPGASGDLSKDSDYEKMTGRHQAFQTTQTHIFPLNFRHCAGNESD
jgi:hypothetical protein